jgi:hypothetical protein
MKYWRMYGDMRPMLYYYAGSVDSKDYMILPGDNLHGKAPAVLKLLNDDLNDE